MEPKQSYARKPHIESGHVKDPEIPERLQQNISHFQLCMASTAVVAERLRQGGPWGKWTSDGDKLLTAMLAEHLGQLEGTISELSQTLSALLFEYPHERLRDVEASLSMVAEEKGVAHAQAILKMFGFETARQVASAPHMFHLIVRDCDRALGVGQQDGDAAAEATSTATDGDAAHEPAWPATHGPPKSPTSQPNWKGRPPTVAQRRDRAVKALQQLLRKRGPKVVEMLIGVPQPGGTLHTGTVFNGGLAQAATWDQIGVDAVALCASLVVENDEDDFI